ncbi:MAG: Holliday junction resolvase RuvX [Bacteroidales bacterium]|nr:Holliday junction resolvase RuvX [Bacteroidales bacterium]
MSEPDPKPLPSTGRLLGVDYGTVRVGLAVCDPERRIASPVDTYIRRGIAADAAYFQKLAREERAVGWVVGLAVHMNGDEGTKAKECRAFGDWLTTETGLPAVFVDERCTSAAAEAFLLDAGLTKKKRKERLDRVAAQIILQTFLDAGCPTET